MSSEHNVAQAVAASCASACSGRATGKALISPSGILSREPSRPRSPVGEEATTPAFSSQRVSNRTGLTLHPRGEGHVPKASGEKPLLLAEGLVLECWSEVERQGLPRPEGRGWAGREGRHAGQESRRPRRARGRGLG